MGLPSALRADAAGRLIGRAARPGDADITDPGFPLFLVTVLTFFPYLWPMEYTGLNKYWTFVPHLLFSIGLGLFHFLFWAFYRMLFPAVPVRLPAADTRFEHLFFHICRIAVFIAIAADAYLVALASTRIGDSMWARKAIVAEGGGIFIFAQLHVWFLGPFLALGLLQGRKVVLPVVILGVLAFLRAVLVSERLALIEFAIPVVVVLAMMGVVRIGWGRLIFLVLFVPIFFLCTEIFRSFYVKFVDVSGDWTGLSFEFVLAWNLERFFSYYADVTNKLYFMLSEQYFYIGDFWASGLTRILARFGIGEIPEFLPIFHAFERFGVRNVELTNPGGLQSFLADFGWWGIGAYGLLIVLLLTAHRQMRLGRAFAYGAYPVLFVTFSDLVRLVYVYESRSVFPMILFLLSYVAARLFSLSHDASRVRFRATA